MDKEAIVHLEAKFIEAFRFQLDQLHDKVRTDFSDESFHAELEQLRSDPVYAKFSFDTAEYVLVRLMGRVSISIGRRLGEIYDKVPRLLASFRYDIPLAEISPRIDGLELDICIRHSLLKALEIEHVRKTVQKYFQGRQPAKGLGIEIRYNFNPNDSSRLRKDDAMAHHLIRDELFPVYLIFSSISPRHEAIARLTRSGWSFLAGEEAFAFCRELFHIDLNEVLGREAIRAEIRIKVGQIMDTLFASYAMKKAVENRSL
jgi:hypothetical protein